MIITEISAVNWRNLARQKVKLGKQLNIFCGENAQGKTNLVETVYMCCLGKSPRNHNDKELICHGKDVAFVRVRYVCRYGEGEIAVTLNARGKKQILINSVSIDKMGELMGYLNCVYFAPEEIRVISDSPAERRRFMDIDLCQTDKNYYYSLSRFNRALAQRNNLLKRAQSVEQFTETVFVWDKQLAEEGAKIVFKRAAFCEELKNLARETHFALTDGKETLELNYVTSLQGNSPEEIAQNYLRMLTENTEKDFVLRHTSVGCQRDDVQFQINGSDARTFGSQGQLRTVALSLKLAELKIFKNLTDEYPVLILDDVLSELDPLRQKRLLNFDPQLQILLTTAVNVPRVLTGENCKFFEIRQGVCREK